MIKIYYINYINNSNDINNDREPQLNQSFSSHFNNKISTIFISLDCRFEPKTKTIDTKTTMYF
jgi:hypothetical protein